MSDILETEFEYKEAKDFPKSAFVASFEDFLKVEQQRNQYRKILEDVLSALSAHHLSRPRISTIVKNAKIRLK